MFSLSLIHTAKISGGSTVVVNLHAFLAEADVSTFCFRTSTARIFSRMITSSRYRLLFAHLAIQAASGTSACACNTAAIYFLLPHLPLLLASLSLSLCFFTPSFMLAMFPSCLANATMPAFRHLLRSCLQLFPGAVRGVPGQSPAVGSKGTAHLQ